MHVSRTHRVDTDGLFEKIIWTIRFPLLFSSPERGREPYAPGLGSPMHTAVKAILKRSGGADRLF